MDVLGIRLPPRGTLARLLLDASFGCAVGAAVLADPLDPAQVRHDLLLLGRAESLVGFEGDSEAGHRGLAHILAGRALPYALPLPIFRLLQGDLDPVDLWLSQGATPSPFHRLEGSTLGVGDALFRDPAGTVMVGRTCFTCHAGAVAGRMVAGLPNAHLDLVPATALAQRVQELDLLARLEAIPQLASMASSLESLVPERASAYYRYLRDYRDYTREVLLPSYRHARARGDDLGSFGAWFMTAKIAAPETSGVVQRVPGDPATASDEALVGTARLPPVDPAPWWVLRYKDHAYRFMDAPGHDPRAFNLNFYVPAQGTDGQDSLERHRERWARRATLVGEVLQFARETTPPPLPASLAGRLAARPEMRRQGERLFHGGENSTGRPMGCAHCHGSYRQEGARLWVDYPASRLRDVRTDPAYNQVLQSFAPLSTKLARTRNFYGPELAPYSRPVTRPGYVPPVLVGVWASAPYLHNGSVPTLADLLEAPGARPRLWERRVDAPLAYDTERVGLPAREVDPETASARARAAAGQGPESPASLELRRVFDTRGHGRSNLGHSFGSDLDPTEKRALLDFLVSLAPRPGLEAIEPVPRGALAAPAATRLR